MKIRNRACERGSITAETAIVFPALVLMLCFAIWGITAASAALRCGDAARGMARSLARGDSESTARSLASANAPANAVIAVQRSNGTVRVEVTSDVRPFGANMPLLPPLPVRAAAVAAVETTR